MADGGLRHAQLVGGAGEVCVARCGFEHADGGERRQLAHHGCH
jgi:hypothetical protein